MSVGTASSSVVVVIIVDESIRSSRTRRRKKDENRGHVDEEAIVEIVDLRMWTRTEEDQFIQHEIELRTDRGRGEMQSFQSTRSNGSGEGKRKINGICIDLPGAIRDLDEKNAVASSQLVNQSVVTFVPQKSYRFESANG